MKTAWQINMDFERAMGAARKLRDIASGLDNNVQELQSTINSIDRSWDGENSEAYIAKGQKVQKNITITAGGLRSAAAAIETIAIRTRDAELAAISIAGD